MLKQGLVTLALVCAYIISVCACFVACILLYCS